jgi:hypothetical protein
VNPLLLPVLRLSQHESRCHVTVLAGRPSLQVGEHRILGANIGAVQDPGNIIQASDDEMESMMAERIAAVGLAIDRRVPRGTIPGREAGVVHRGGGRYMSVIGRNALFHNPADRGPEAVNQNVIARFELPSPKRSPGA